MKGWILHHTKRVLFTPKNSHLFIKLALNSNLSHKRESRTNRAAFLFLSRNQDALLFNRATNYTTWDATVPFPSRNRETWIFNHNGTDWVFFYNLRFPSQNRETWIFKHVAERRREHMYYLFPSRNRETWIFKFKPAYELEDPTDPFPSRNRENCFSSERKRPTHATQPFQVSISESRIFDFQVYLGNLDVAVTFEFPSRNRETLMFNVPATRQSKTI